MSKTTTDYHNNRLFVYPSAWNICQFLESSGIIQCWSKRYWLKLAPSPCDSVLIKSNNSAPVNVGAEWCLHNVLRTFLILLDLNFSNMEAILSTFCLCCLTSSVFSSLFTGGHRGPERKDEFFTDCAVLDLVVRFLSCDGVVLFWPRLVEEPTLRPLHQCTPRWKRPVGRLFPWCWVGSICGDPGRDPRLVVSEETEVGWSRYRTCDGIVYSLWPLRYKHSLCMQIYLTPHSCAPLVLKETAFGSFLN